MGVRLAAWLADDADTAANRAVSNPAALGIGKDLIGFGGGQPAAELYPLEALQRAFSKAILEDGREVLPYGPSEGCWRCARSSPTASANVASRSAPRTCW